MAENALDIKIRATDAASSIFAKAEEAVRKFRERLSGREGSQGGGVSDQLARAAARGFVIKSAIDAITAATHYWSGAQSEVNGDIEAAHKSFMQALDDIKSNPIGKQLYRVADFFTGIGRDIENANEQMKAMEALTKSTAAYAEKFRDAMNAVAARRDKTATEVASAGMPEPRKSVFDLYAKFQAENADIEGERIKALKDLQDKYNKKLADTTALFATQKAGPAVDTGDPAIDAMVREKVGDSESHAKNVAAAKLRLYETYLRERQELQDNYAKLAAERTTQEADKEIKAQDDWSKAQKERANGITKGLKAGWDAIVGGVMESARQNRLKAQEQMAEDAKAAAERTIQITADTQQQELENQGKHFEALRVQEDERHRQRMQQIKDHREREAEERLHASRKTGITEDEMRQQQDRAVQEFMENFGQSRGGGDRFARNEQSRFMRGLGNAGPKDLSKPTQETAQHTKKTAEATDAIKTLLDKNAVSFVRVRSR